MGFFNKLYKIIKNGGSYHIIHFKSQISSLIRINIYIYIYNKKHNWILNVWR